MAAPLVPVLLIVGRSVGMALRRWQGIVALAGLIFATGFTFNSMLRQMGDTAISLWPLLSIICFTFLPESVMPQPTFPLSSSA